MNFKLGKVFVNIRMPNTNYCTLFFFCTDFQNNEIYE